MCNRIHASCIGISSGSRVAFSGYCGPDREHYAIPVSSEVFARWIANNPTKSRLTVLTDHPAYPNRLDIKRKDIDVFGRKIWIGARAA